MTEHPLDVVIMDLRESVRIMFRAREPEWWAPPRQDVASIRSMIHAIRVLEWQRDCDRRWEPPWDCAHECARRWARMQVRSGRRR